MSNRDFSNFQYIVDYRIKNPICFGSKLERKTDLIGRKIDITLGPGHYNLEKYNSVVREGAGAPFCQEPRFKSKNVLRVPSPTRYYKQQIWKSCKVYRTFEKQLARITDYSTKTPGPGSYETRPPFGKQKTQPHIESFCTPKLVDTCSNCDEFCNYDYWHQDHTIFLCHICWLEKKFNGDKDLKKFKKIRNCSFKHQHDGTYAAIQLLPQRQLIKKIRTENYLDRYIHC